MMSSIEENSTSSITNIVANWYKRLGKVVKCASKQCT